MADTAIPEAFTAELRARTRAELDRIAREYLRRATAAMQAANALDEVEADVFTHDDGDRQ